MDALAEASNGTAVAVAERVGDTGGRVVLAPVGTSRTRWQETSSPPATVMTQRRRAALSSNREFIRRPPSARTCWPHSAADAAGRRGGRRWRPLGTLRGMPYRPWSLADLAARLDVEEGAERRYKLVLEFVRGYLEEPRSVRAAARGTAAAR